MTYVNDTDEVKCSAEYYCKLDGSPLLKKFKPQVHVPVHNTGKVRPCRTESVLSLR